MDDIRACCSNVRGPVFYKNYNGSEPVDWDYIYKTRLEYVKKINSMLNYKYIPAECRGCYLIPSFLSDKKVPIPENKISTFWVQNYMFCNANCVYCVFSDFKRDYKYQIVPVFKSLIENRLHYANSKIILSGGEITISPEFEELVDVILSNFDSKIHIFTSGIKYSKSLENAFIQNKCEMSVSLDSGTSETYFTMKWVDCFNNVVDNLKTYLKKAPSAKDNIVLKYILFNGINDNFNELKMFFDTVTEIGIKNVEFDIDYKYYRFECDRAIPEFYFEFCDKFIENAQERNLKFTIGSQTQAIFNKFKK